MNKTSEQVSRQPSRSRAGTEHPPEECFWRHGPMRILVAEDDMLSRIFLRKVLEDAGCTVVEVDNGKDAVRRVEDEQFDLVLMDVQMPLMNGLEALRALRNSMSERVRSTRVIALTAFSRDEERKLFLRAGMDGYMAKPLDLEVLSDTIAGIV